MDVETLQLTSKSGKPFEIKLPAPLPVTPSLFVVAAHKTGSTLMNRLTTEMCARAGRPHVNVELETWRQGIAISDWPDELYAVLERPGYVFDSFRSLQKLPEVAQFRTGRKVFLVRDPRDVVVSFYFSMLKSHVAPQKGGETAKNLVRAREIAEAKDIETYVRDDDCGVTLRNMQRFCEYYGGADTTFFKYEDIIFAKREWIETLADLLSVSLPKDALHAIADKNDIRPEKEDASKHIRQVTPGNHTKHLSDDVIALLRERYTPLFDTFGY